MRELLHLLENSWAVPQSRKIMMLFLGCTMILCIFVAQVINVKQEGTVEESEGLALNDKTKSPIFQPVTGNENKIIKDPFAVPVSFREKAELPAVRQSEKTAKPQKIPSAARVNHLPILTGLMGSDDRFIAILEYGGVSRQCLLEDSIGPYKIVEINEKNVVLNGPSGAITLTVGR